LSLTRIAHSITLVRLGGEGDTAEAIRIIELANITEA
jgi:hypothetical protein